MTPSAIQDLDGKYEILDKVGEGGLGAVYRVRHRLLDEIRVIKLLRPQAAARADLQQRFIREARLATRLSHRNIARLHDFSVAADDSAFIVMEYVDGVSLDRVLASAGPPSVGLTVEIARQALTALDVLHGHDLVHRDVAPDNLLLGRDFDGTPLVKLIDLGIAKLLGEDDGFTVTGMFLGKARYSSPEQFRVGADRPSLDRRSDVYSFGVLLYELLTGVPPLSGASLGELAKAHLFDPPREFDGADPAGRVPDGLRAVVLRALAKDPAERFATAAAMAREIEPFAAPAAELEEELERLLRRVHAGGPAASAGAPSRGAQRRLDAAFGPQTTPSPASASAYVAGRTAVAGGLGGLVARLEPGGWASSAVALRHSLVESWVRQSPARRGLAVAMAVLATAGVAGAAWLLARTSAAAIAAPRAAAVRVEQTPGWSAAAAPAAGGGDARWAELEPPQPPPAPRPPGDAAPADPAPSAAGAPPTYRAEVDVVPPVLVAMPAPAYPEGARKRGEPVEIQVSVLVDETGKVLAAAARNGGWRFRQAAEQAARSARFRPAAKAGVPGRMWVELPVVFDGDLEG